MPDKGTKKKLTRVKGGTPAEKKERAFVPTDEAK